MSTALERERKREKERERERERERDRYCCICEERSKSVEFITFLWRPIRELHSTDTASTDNKRQEVRRYHRTEPLGGIRHRSNKTTRRTFDSPMRWNRQHTSMIEHRPTEWEVRESRSAVVATNRRVSTAPPRHRVRGPTRSHEAPGSDQDPARCTLHAARCLCA